MYYLFIATAIWIFSGCGDEGGKGAPTGAGNESQTSVAFADTSLEGAVRQALKRPVGALRSSDLAGLSELEARGRGIVSLQGIGQLPNLTRLDLADNRIEDLAPLASLSKLKYLDLDNNQVRDLSALAGLSQLEVVVLGHNQVQDLSPLLGLSHLKSAELSGNPLNGGVENAQLAALQEKGVEVSFQVAPDAPQTPSPESPTFGNGPRLAFIGTSPEGQSDIYVLDVESGAIVNLTTQPEQYTELAWSPDGEKIAFLSYDNPKVLGSNLFVMDADGGNRARLTPLPGQNEWLAWSPGPVILFSSQHLLEYPIIAMNADGSQAASLREGSGPAWSPDGSRVALTSSGEIYVVEVDGSAPSAVTHRLPSVGPPAWSPDGRQLAFAMTDEVVATEDSLMVKVGILQVGRPDIVTAEVGTDSLRRLTDHPAADINPAWSPDGTRIAFASNRDGNWEIYLMGADGSDPVNLSNDPGQDILPRWSPDGRVIAYAHEFGTDIVPENFWNIEGSVAYAIPDMSLRFLKGAFFHLYLVHPEGGPSIDLTTQGVECSGPFAWAPR